MEGKGVHVCAEGSRYEGQFRANYRHGHGKCQWGNRHDTPFRHVPGRCCRYLTRQGDDHTFLLRAKRKSFVHFLRRVAFDAQHELSYRPLALPVVL